MAIWIERQMVNQSTQNRRLQTFLESTQIYQIILEGRLGL